MRLITALTLSSLCLAGSAGRIQAGFLKKRPKLVLLLVVDQFRADYLMRFQDRFLPAQQGKVIGGFRYLTEKGAWFPYAEFMTLQNMTAPGHATFLTGAYPFLTGIPLNEWFNRETGKRVYNTFDKRFQWWEETPDPIIGTSPANLIGTTLGDELRVSSPESRVVSLSLKDRAAILMGGHNPTAAFWVDPARAHWTTTRYYTDSFPGWLTALNKSMDGRKDQPVFGDAIAKELKFPLLKAPGPFSASARWGEKSAQATPAGLWMTQVMAEKAIQEYKLGQRAQSDILALSFSTHDLVGHTYGPDHPAIEEISVAEDKVLSQLFNFLQKTVPGGLNNVLIALSADHGVAANPELVKSKRIPAGRVDEDALQAKLNRALDGILGKHEKGWVARIKEMNFYLNSGDKPAVQVEQALKSELLKEEAIAHVFTLSEFHARHLPPGIFEKQILNSYFPGRSGDVIGILKPFYVSGDDTADHQTGYRYDRTVPIIFAGSNIQPGTYAETIEVIDIAPTLAFLMGTVPPSQSTGRVLHEIFKE